MKYTLAVTSCGRPELLQQTLTSFCAHAEILPWETVVIEDAGIPKPAWVDTLPLGPVRWIRNGKRRGQIFSLDRLYDSIKTEWIFHTEDDWQYIRPGFLVRSFQLLEKFPHLWTVSLRGADCNGHPLDYDPITKGAMHMPGWRGGWGGMHFNPGARRLSDYRKLGGYGRHAGYGTHGCGHELKLSQMHLDAGFRIGVLLSEYGPVPFIKHLGGGQSVAVLPVPPGPKVLIAVPATHSYQYGEHRLPIERETEGRVDAVRATWFKDAAVHPNVTARFFYGASKTPVAPPKPDEIFLDCPDDYPRLFDKVRAICAWAQAQGFDYLVKCDDDTVLYVDRLLRSDFAQYPQMGFFNCKHPEGYARCQCYITGMCYTLSARAMALVAKSGPSAHWAEDLSVGSILKANKLRRVGHPGFVPGFREHYVKFPLPEGTIAAHAVRPQDMRTWYRDITGQLGPNSSSTGLVDPLTGDFKSTIKLDGKEKPCVTYKELPLALL